MPRRRNGTQRAAMRGLPGGWMLDLQLHLLLVGNLVLMPFLFVELFRSSNHEDPGTKQIVQAINDLSGSAYHERLRETTEQLKQDMESMGEKVKEAGGQFEPLIKQLEEAIKAFEKASTEFGTTSAAIAKDAQTTGREIQTARQLVEDAAEKNKTLMDALNNKVDQVITVFNKTTASLGSDLEAHFANLDTSLQKQVKHHVEELTEIVRQNLNTTTSHLQSASSEMTDIKQQLTKLQRLDEIATQLQA